MKNKILITMTALLVTLALTACASDSGGSQQAADLSTVIEKLYQNIEVPPNETIVLDKDNFEYFAFIPYGDGLTGAAADALVNITPHSLVVIHTDGGNGAELAEQVSENADPNKWLCVRADSLRVAYTDHYVVLVMSDREMVEDVMENFKAMAKDLDGMEMQLLPGK